jgi:hypothetical protein
MMKVITDLRADLQDCIRSHGLLKKWGKGQKPF